MDNEVDVTTMTDAEPEESEAEEFDRGCTRCARQFAILTTAERNLAARSRSLLLASGGLPATRVRHGLCSSGAGKWRRGGQHR